MNKLKLALTTLLFVFLFSFTGKSQGSLLEQNDLSNIKIDSYSDEQINSLFQKSEELNMSKSDLFNKLVEKRIPQTELQKLKNRTQNLSVPTDKTQDYNTSRRNYDEKQGNIPMEDNKKDLSIFGAELFTKNSLVFEPNIRIPTPSSYILGTDDELVINVFGSSEKKYNLKVSEDGQIYIPNVGPLFVSGLSIEQATLKIKSKLSKTIYRSINSGQTSLQISLGNIKSIRVVVIGEAEKTGTYTVSSLTTLFNLLYLCGGPKNTGSYRNIEVIRGNQLFKKADLYSFLLNGSKKDDILLQEGDVVKIPFCKTLVSINGNVRREGKYEMQEKETFDRLLELCGGLDDRAYKGSATLISLTDTGRKVVTIINKEFAFFQLKSGDQVFINRVQNSFSNRIYINGSIERPGNYELIEGMTLKDLIEKSGGLLPDAFTNTASIFRIQKNKLPAILNVNIDSVTTGEQSITLNNNDSVYINSILDFKDNIHVNVDGKVRNPNMINWREGLTLRDVIIFSGGVSEQGDSNNIEISRRIKNANVDQINHMETEKIVTSLSENISLQPFDYIIIKPIIGYVEQRSIIINGDVTLPSKYILQKSEERIFDIIKRAQGFRASADSSFVTIRRKNKNNSSLKEREILFQRLLNIESDSIEANKKLQYEIYKNYESISVNITNLLKDSTSSENLILEDGDILTIEKNNNLVKVSGEVYYPTTLPFVNGRSAKYFIKLAGSFMPTARKSGTIVIYPNGKAKAVKRFLFLKFYPKVTSRSEVFIPQKNKESKIRTTPAELAVFISALGIIANVLINLIK
jgi:protein involved in polysaccharide export with SLBB domain